LPENIALQGNLSPALLATPRPIKWPAKRRAFSWNARSARLFLNWATAFAHAKLENIAALVRQCGV